MTQPANPSELREQILDLLKDRRFDDCEALLEKVSSQSTPALRHACMHYRAVVLSVQRKHDRAETILRALLAEEIDATQRARSLMELAIQLDELGRWQEAEPLYRDAIQLFEVQENWLGAAKAHNNLGICITFQVEQQAADKTRVAEAIEEHGRALSILHSLDDDQAGAVGYETALNHHGLGKAHVLQGNLALAEEALRRFIQSCLDNGDDHGAGFGLSDLADGIMSSRGDYAGARDELDRAIQRLAGSGDLLDLAEAHVRRGRANSRLGNLSAAEADFEEAVTIAESLQVQMEAMTARSSYRATIDSVYTAPLTLYLHENRSIDALTAAERARSRTLADLLAQTELKPRHETPLRLHERRNAVREKLDQAFRTGAPTTELEDDLQTIERRIELVDPAFANLARFDSLTGEEICASLPANAVLAMFQVDDAGQLWLLAVKQNEINLRKLQGPKLKWLDRFLMGLLDGERTGFLVPDAQTGQLQSPQFWGELYRYYAEPLLEVAENSATLYLCPTGALNRLPLAMLAPAPWERPPLCVQPRRIIYAPNATTLFGIRRSRNVSPLLRMLAIAPEDDRLSYTQGAAVNLASDSHSKALLGGHATRTGVIDAASNYQVVCFLGHAIFNNNYPMLSGLQLDDGLFYAADMFHSLRLTCNTIMLAACESGRTQVLRGDELFGLSRALLYAGAQSMIVTLWPVHEVPTRLLVERTWHEMQHVQETIPGDPATALMAAQLWLQELTLENAVAALAAWQEVGRGSAARTLLSPFMERVSHFPAEYRQYPFRHPYYWAPFIMLGDPTLTIMQHAEKPH